jgi:hypothetical protein
MEDTWVRETSANQAECLLSWLKLCPPEKQAELIETMLDLLKREIAEADAVIASRAFGGHSAAGRIRARAAERSR